MKENWQERLKRYEATPPAQLWDRVEESLDQDPASVAERLHAYAPAPPAGMWDRIEQQLDATVTETELVPVVPIRRRSSFYAYAAAAAVLGILLVGTALLLNRHHAGAPSVALRENSKTPVTENPAPFHSANASTPDNSVDRTPAIEAPASAPLVAIRTTDKETPAITRSAPALSESSVPNNSYASARHAAAIAAAPLDEDRYLVRAYNNGSTVRFSKKVSAVVDCAEHSAGFAQSLCKVSIGAVQEKLATTLNTDFGGLIERLQDLETSK